jgi:hypothetical protein
MHSGHHLASDADNCIRCNTAPSGVWLTPARHTPAAACQFKACWLFHQEYNWHDYFAIVTHWVRGSLAPLLSGPFKRLPQHFFCRAPRLYLHHQALLC